jgi:hypothetical protein
MTFTQRPIPSLRAQLERCVPDAVALASRTSIVLTPRDKALLEAIYNQGFLTADIVELAFFPPQIERRSPSSCAYERLRQLWLSGYVERVEVPTTRKRGHRPLLYAIGRAALPVLTARLERSTSVIQQRRLGRLDVRALDHDLMAARLWACLHRNLPTTRLTGWRWTPERTLRAQRLRVKPRGSRLPLAFLPDAYAEFDYPSGAVQCCVVEIDNATLPLRRFKRKLRAFEAFLSQGRFEAWSGHDNFEVLILASSRNRMHHLHQAAREVVDGPGWSAYSFATFDVLDPTTFPYGWWPLDHDDEHDTVGLYFPQAYEVGEYGPDGERERPQPAPPTEPEEAA